MNPINEAESRGEIRGAGVMMDAWDKHERHVARILIAAGHPDLWRQVYADYCKVQDIPEDDPFLFLEDLTTPLG